ncbi:Hemicentin-1 [Merluccius polli]|uniref:Hemicentin-1 n=1 Tax=Merluccius polli TaxID=89951 RepID=A0AA47MJH4_MERPO|nr:Hemicentin-1 [Merluccius polli]
MDRYTTHCGPVSSDAQQNPQDKNKLDLPPSIQPGPRVMKVQVGHPVELPCVARGDPEPSVTWTKDGAPHPAGAAADGSLVLSAVGLGDEGSYACLASNVAGTAEARVQLLVQDIKDYIVVLWILVLVLILVLILVLVLVLILVQVCLLMPPVVEVLEPPFNSPLQERVANQRIAFPCPATGLPKPVIRWLRNGEELTGVEPGVSILEDGTLLLLSSVSPLDNGEYSCTAANDAGSTQKKYQLKVNGDVTVLLAASVLLTQTCPYVDVHTGQRSNVFSVLLRGQFRIAARVKKVPGLIPNVRKMPNPYLVLPRSSFMT